MHTEECTHNGLLIAPARFDYRLLQITLLAFVIGYGFLPFVVALIGGDDFACWGGMAGPLASVLISLIAMRCSFGSWREVASEMGLTRFPRMIAIMALPISFLIVMATGLITLAWSEAAELCGWTFGTPPTTEIIMNGTPLELTAFVITALVAAPFFEELLFRKAIFEAVNVKCGRTVAYMVASLGFAAMHFTLLQLPALTFIALCWQFISRHQRSLWASIILHLCNNLLAAAIALLSRFVDFSGIVTN